MSIDVLPLKPMDLPWAQAMVIKGHYLHKPVDPRCSPLAYIIQARNYPLGCLIFGRPEATRCGNWYGSVADVVTGKCAITRWQVLNLARVFILPEYQGERAEIYRGTLPGYEDRKGKWHSTLPSTAINMALDRVVVDYLLARPPCFLEEPYKLVHCLSYCDTRIHSGFLYRVAGFELVRTNDKGIQTWRKPFRPLTDQEDCDVQAVSLRSARSKRYRAIRENAMYRQMQFSEA